MRERDIRIVVGRRVWDSRGRPTVEAEVVSGTTLPVSWLRAHSDRRVTLASLEVGRVMSGLVGPGALAGNFEMLLDATPFLVVQQPDAGRALVNCLHNNVVAGLPLHAARPVHDVWRPDVGIDP